MSLRKPNKPTLIKGGFHEDERGRVDFVNDFDLSNIKRFYFITNTSNNIFRGWQGHKIEKRWFYCVKGSFEVKIIEIDNWQNPSDDLCVTTYILKENDVNVLYIPNGYVNGFKSLEHDSKLMALSNYLLGENPTDDFRFDSDKWKTKND